MQCVRDCEATDPKDRKLFEQPVIQTYANTVRAGSPELVRGPCWRRAVADY